MASHVFCRDIALERGEPMEGTGRIEERVLLLAWPRGYWRNPREASVGMSVALGEAVRKARRNNPYLILVDRVGDSENIPKLTAFPEAVSFTPADTNALIEAITRWGNGEPLTGTPEPRITVVCCTDSRSDACCARFGFATYKALIAEADPAKFNVLQSSHIGGCRFATSLAVVSRRQRYARLDPEQVPEFLATIEAGDIYLPAFKGRADLAEPEQVAELAALRWAAKAGNKNSQVHLGDAQTSDDMHLTYEAQIGAEKLVIALEAKVFDMHGKCVAITRDPPKPTKRWLVRDVTHLAS